MKINAWLFATTLAAVTVVSAPVLATIEGKEPRPFEAQITIAPLVVVARMVEPLGTSIKAFKNVEKPFIEVYTHYLMAAQKVLKGTLKDNMFQIRSIGGESGNLRSKPVAKFEMGQVVLLALSPDVGKDPSGRERRGYVIVYQAQYPVRDEHVEVPTAEGTKRLSIDQVVRLIAQIETAERKRGEPAEVRFDVSAGGEGRTDEAPPSPQIRDAQRGEPLPKDRLREAKPNLRQTPKDMAN